MTSRKEFVNALNEAAIQSSGKVKPDFNQVLFDNAVRHAYQEGLIPPNISVESREDGWYDYPVIYYWATLKVMKVWLTEKRPRNNHMRMARINENALRLLDEWLDTGKNFWE